MSVTTRRGLLGGAAVLVATTAAGATAHADADAELIAIALQVEEGERRLYESDRFTMGDHHELLAWSLVNDMIADGEAMLPTPESVVA